MKTAMKRMAFFCIRGKGILGTWSGMLQTDLFEIIALTGGPCFSLKGFSEVVAYGSSNTMCTVSEFE